MYNARKSFKLEPPEFEAADYKDVTQQQQLQLIIFLYQLRKNN